LKQNRPAEAALEYQSALQRRPDSARTFRQLGSAYRMAGDFNRAGDAFRRAADLSGDDVQTQLRAGWYSLLLNQPKAAQAYAQRVLAVDPNNVSALRLLANATAALGDLDHAVDDLKKAANLEPLQATVFSNLGALEASRGDNNAAQAAFDRASELASSGGPSSGAGPGLLGPVGFPSGGDHAGQPGGQSTVIDGNLDLGGVPSAPGGPSADAPPPVVLTIISAPGKGGPSVEFQAHNGSSGSVIRTAAVPAPPANPPATSVPEPGSLMLVLSGALASGGAYIARRRQLRRRTLEDIKWPEPAR
jgi:Tfp pilus assembly protein PilF